MNKMQRNNNRETAKELYILVNFDDYGNPKNGDRIINCCFPNCGCDGARLCMSENGSSSCADSMNIEKSR